MDEGRLGMVLRRVEQQRKYVYMVNDIVRAQHGLYHSCLAREEREAETKLTKSSVEMRRAIVRQRVLLQCLQMRRQKVVARDPAAPLGAYGGKPLWAMSRDIDHVIADNHPRVRRMRRVRAIMRQSLETGAILDTQAVSRRMEEFFVGKKKKEEAGGRNGLPTNGKLAHHVGDRKRPLLPPLESKVSALVSKLSHASDAFETKTQGEKKDEKMTRAPVEIPTGTFDGVEENAELEAEGEVAFSHLIATGDDKQRPSLDETNDNDKQNGAGDGVRSADNQRDEDDEIDGRTADRGDCDVTSEVSVDGQTTRSRDRLRKQPSLVLPPIQMTKSLVSARKK